MKRCHTSLALPSAVSLVLGLMTFGCGNRTSDSTPTDVSEPHMVPVQAGNLDIDIATATHKTSNEVISVRQFWISSSEITCSEYAFFLNSINYTSEVARIDGGRLFYGKTTISLGLKGFGPNLTHIYLIEGVENSVRRKSGRYFPLPGKESVPMEGVTFAGAQAYCKWLSRKTGENYRLPWEAEWAYAATVVGDKVVGMPGGVWEWCLDYYDEKGMTRPRLLADGSDNVARSNRRVLRGGSWVSDKSSGWASAAKRTGKEDRGCDNEIPLLPDSVGFRILRTDRTGVPSTEDGHKPPL